MGSCQGCTFLVGIRGVHFSSWQGENAGSGLALLSPTPFLAHGEAQSRLVKGRERRGGEQGGGAASPTNRLASLHPSSICRFIKSRANSNIISFKQLHLAGVRNLFEIKKTITERQQSSKTTSET